MRSEFGALKIAESVLNPAKNRAFWPRVDITNDSSRRARCAVLCSAACAASAYVGPHRVTPLGVRRVALGSVALWNVALHCLPASRWAALLRHAFVTLGLVCLIALQEPEGTKGATAVDVVALVVVARAGRNAGDIGNGRRPSPMSPVKVERSETRHGSAAELG